MDRKIDDTVMQSYLEILHKRCLSYTESLALSHEGRKEINFALTVMKVLQNNKSTNKW